MSLITKVASKLVSKDDTSQVIKYVLFSLVFMAFCAFETSFWPNVISFIESPQLWLIFIVFIVVRWTERWNLFYLYFLGYTLTLYSMMPLKMAWFSLIVVYAVLYFLKMRIHSTTAGTFSILTAAVSILYSVVYIGFSHLFEKNPTAIMPLTRLSHACMNFIFSIPVFIMLDWLNGFFKTSVEVNENKTIKSIVTPREQDF